MFFDSQRWRVGSDAEKTARLDAALQPVREQFERVRREIDAIMQDELELDRRVAKQVDLKYIRRLVPAHLLMDGEDEPGDTDPRRGADRQGPSGSLDKLVDQLQTLLGRVSERRHPFA